MSDILPRSTPEEQGIPSEKIMDFFNHVAENRLELHSFMLLRHGVIVSEGWWKPYKPEFPHMLFSLSKSFTSTAIGFAVAEGRLSVEEDVLRFFPEYAPKEPDANLRTMKVKHLLSMSTGHAEDTMGPLFSCEDGIWVKAFLSLPVQYEPGTHFVYNTGATYMLSAILQRLTDQTLLDYLTPRLFEPLHITDPTWETCPQGINTGGFGLSIKTEDIARFGQFYLQEGEWNGRQLLPKEWICEAVQSHISNGDGGSSDWGQGYGYQFWRCRHGAYRGDGAFGQYCIVHPEKQMVIAITSGLDDMQAVLNFIWEDLLPNMGTTRLAANEQAYSQLQTLTQRLELQPPTVNSTSPRISELTNRRYVFSENPLDFREAGFEFSTRSHRISLLSSQGEKQLICGSREWIEDQEGLPFLPGRLYASSTWLDESTYQVTVRFVETPFFETLVFRFSEKTLQVDSYVNVSFGPKERPTFYGQLKE